MPELASLVPESVPYPIRGGILRGVRTAIAFVLAGVVASVADGSLLNTVKIVPPEYAPFVTGALGTLLVSVDKFLREKGLIDQAAEDAAGLHLSDSVTPPSVVDVPAPAVNVDSGAPEDVPTTDTVPSDVPAPDQVAEEDVPIVDDGGINPTEFDDDSV